MFTSSQSDSFLEVSHVHLQNPSRIMKNMQNAIRGTLEEHKVIHMAIEHLATLEEPKKEVKENA